MFGVSPTELIIVLSLALLLLGPDQLPSVAKTLGRTLRELQNATDGLKSSFERQMATLDRQHSHAKPAAVAESAEPLVAVLPPADIPAGTGSRT